ncbi:MAG: hypothetical protein V5A57_02090 [Candidatus Paceibacterota bacterium]
MKISKVWILPLVLMAALAFTPALAQETLPEGGSNFQDAVELSPGSYTDGEITNDTSYYYSLEEIQPGESLFLERTAENSDELEYGDVKIKLYNQDRAEVISAAAASGEQKATLHWLPGTNQEDGNYYLKIESGSIWGADKMKFSLDYETEDRFDAGSGKDAGDEIPEALKVEPGNYSGYLFGSGEKAADTMDSYKLEVDKGEKLVAEVTPPVDGVAGIAFFNENRQKLVSKLGSNPGAVVEEFFAPSESGTYYVKVKIQRTEGEEIIDYDINFALEEAKEEEIPVQEDTEESTEEIPEEVQQQLPEDWQDELPDDVKKELEGMEGKSPEEIQKELKEQLPSNYYNMIFEGKSPVQGLKTMIFNFLKKVLMWFAGLVVLIIVIIIVFKKLGSSDSEEDSEEPSEKVSSDDKPSDKGPNKSDN